MFASDLPIHSKAQDKLNRASFAESFGKAILDYQGEDSLVLGLYGSWGSGKTSVLNMVLEYINTSAAEKPIVLKFNPWNYSDQSQLIAQYFAELKRVLPTKKGDKGYEKASRLLDLYAETVAPLVVIPNPSSPMALGQAAVCKALSGVMRFFIKSKNTSLQEIKEELNHILKKQNRKLLVLIDDIDRLNNIEIRQIFQLVKSLADFKNTIYLLAFDRGIVIESLKKVQEGDGNEYLEKVVQVPFSLPMLAITEVHRFLFSSLDEIIKDLPQVKFDQGYWTNIFASGISCLFTSIRDVNRFINIFRFKYYLLKNEVNITDLIAITAIQVFMPDLYIQIHGNKNMFVEGYKDHGYEHDRKQTLKESFNDIVKRTVKNDLSEKVIELLKVLFPKISSFCGNFSYGSSFDSEWRKLGRICSGDNFDIYFQFAPMSEQITKSEIEKIITDSKSYNNLENALRKYWSGKRVSEILERLLDYSENLDIDQIQNIVSVLMKHGDSFPKDDEGMFGFDNYARIGRVFYFLTKHLNDHDKCFNIFKNAIENSDNSLHTILEAVEWLDWEYGKWTKQNPKPLDECRVNQSQLQELEKLASSKIENWANDGRLLKHSDMVRILCFWESWAGKQVVQDYVQKTTTDESGLVNFIEKYPSKVKSQSMGDYGYRIEYQVHLDAIKRFVDLDKIIPRLRTILLGEKYNELTDDQKRAIQLVLDTYDGKIKPLL